MLGLFKIAGNQVDVWVGDCQSFLCDAFVGGLTQLQEQIRHHRHVSFDKVQNLQDIHELVDCLKVSTVEHKRITLVCSSLEEYQQTKNNLYIATENSALV